MLLDNLHLQKERQILNVVYLFVSRRLHRWRRLLATGERPEPKSGLLPFLDPIRQPLSKIYKWRWIIYIEHSFAFINLYFTTNLASGLWCNRQASTPSPAEQPEQSTKSTRRLAKTRSCHFYSVVHLIKQTGRQWMTLNELCLLGVTHK